MRNFNFYHAASGGIIVFWALLASATVLLGWPSACATGSLIPAVGVAFVSFELGLHVPAKAAMPQLTHRRTPRKRMGGFSRN